MLFGGAKGQPSGWLVVVVGAAETVGVVVGEGMLGVLGALGRRKEQRLAEHGQSSGRKSTLASAGNEGPGGHGVIRINGGSA